MFLYYLIVFGASTYVGGVILTLISLGYERWALNCDFCPQTFFWGMLASFALGAWYFLCWKIDEDRKVHRISTVMATAGCMVPFFFQALVAWIF